MSNSAIDVYLKFFLFIVISYTQISQAETFLPKF